MEASWTPCLHRRVSTDSVECHQVGAGSVHAGEAAKTVSRLALERVRKLQVEEQEREKDAQLKHDALQVAAMQLHVLCSFGRGRPDPQLLERL